MQKSTFSFRGCYNRSTPIWALLLTAILQKLNLNVYSSSSNGPDEQVRVKVQVQVQVLLGRHLPALPQGAAVMTGHSAAAQPHWARLITGSSPAGELWRAAWHRSTRFSSRLHLGLFWQWVSLEFTLLVNKHPPPPPLTYGNWWIIGGALFLLWAALVFCYVQWSMLCNVVCARTIRAHTYTHVCSL